MSRSKNKSKYQGITTATSEKKNKQEANRKFRRKVKLSVKAGEIDLPSLRSVSNVFSFDKDGKVYDSSMSDKDLRK